MTVKIEKAQGRAAGKGQAVRHCPHCRKEILIIFSDGATSKAGVDAFTLAVIGVLGLIFVFLFFLIK